MDGERERREEKRVYRFLQCKKLDHDQTVDSFVDSLQ
jgi:hypothetical protein